MVQPGAQINTGQSVMDLETDKAVVEVPSSVSGTVQEIRVKEGDKIKVGQVIFTVDGAEAKTPAQPAAKSAAAAPQQAPAAQMQAAEPVTPPRHAAPASSTHAATSAPAAAVATAGGASEFKLAELGE